MAPGVGEMIDFIPRSGYRPYYESLTPRLRRMYGDLLLGLVCYRDVIVLPSEPGDDAQVVFDLYHQMKEEITELYFVKHGGGSWAQVSSGPNARFIFSPEYLFSPAEARATEAEIVRRTSPFLLSLEGLSPTRKIERIHDWVLTRYHYEDVERRYVQEAPGVLLYGTSVCEGVAKAVKWLCDRCGVQCLVAIGKTGSEDEREAKESLHAWNIVNFGTPGQPVWRHVDATWDQGEVHGRPVAHHGYFGLSDRRISVNHEVGAESFYPRCPRSYDWYRVHGRYASGPDAFLGIARDVIARGEKVFSVRVPRPGGGDEDRECALIREAGRAAGEDIGTIYFVDNKTLGIHTFAWD